MTISVESDWNFAGYDFLGVVPSGGCGHIWKVPVARRYQVWLVGHSIVHWAGRYAKKSGWGEHLGLDTSVDIRWLARRGMTWPALLLRLRNSVLQFGFPDAVLLQLGENDIPASKGVALQNSMRDDLMLLHHKMPKTKLFWSCLLERRTWRNAVAPARVNKTRSKLCRSAARLVLSMGGGMLFPMLIYLMLCQHCFCPMESTYRIGARTSGCGMMSAMLCYCSGSRPH
uniref:Uncharacterized protein n=1 Tax=Sphaerodactylus townsendi TaxID=933632 RepID=A0ACB8FTL8_9SAUR